MLRLVVPTLLATLALSCGVVGTPRLRLPAASPCEVTVEAEADDYEATVSCVILDRLPWDAPS